MLLSHREWSEGITPSCDINDSGVVADNPLQCPQICETACVGDARGAVYCRRMLTCLQASLAAVMLESAIRLGTGKEGALYARVQMDVGGREKDRALAVAAVDARGGKRDHPERRWWSVPVASTMIASERYNQVARTNACDSVLSSWSLRFSFFNSSAVNIRSGGRLVAGRNQSVVTLSHGISCHPMTKLGTADRVDPDLY